KLEDIAMPGRVSITRGRLLASAAAGAIGLAAPAIVYAQGSGAHAALKVGVLLPKSGFEASTGQDCQRGIDIAPSILKSLGLPELAIINADTESSVDVARRSPPVSWCWITASLSLVASPKRLCAIPLSLRPISVRSRSDAARRSSRCVLWRCAGSRRRI